MATTAVPGSRLMALQKNSREGPGGRWNEWHTMAGESARPGEIARRATSQPPRTDSRRKNPAKASAPPTDQCQGIAGSSFTLIQAAANTTGPPTIHELQSVAVQPKPDERHQGEPREESSRESGGRRRLSLLWDWRSCAVQVFGQRCHR